jgi:hypothetical protein
MTSCAQPTLHGSDAHGRSQGVARGAVSDHGLDDDEPASLGGGDSMVAVSKKQSLFGAEDNHRGRSSSSSA